MKTFGPMKRERKGKRREIERMRKKREKKGKNLEGGKVWLLIEQ